MIPKTFHQFWTGGPMPAVYRRFIAGWKELHPDWEFILWGEERDIPKLQNQDAYDRAEEIIRRTVSAFRSDVLRYELLYRYGGVWLDVDIEPVRPVDELLENLKAFCSWEIEGRVATNAFMGCVKGHPWAKALMDGIPGAVRGQSGARPSALTGPHYLTRHLTPEVEVFPEKLFFPYRCKDAEEGWSKHYPEAYGVHHWNSQGTVPDVPMVRPDSPLKVLASTKRHRVLVLAQGRSARWEYYMDRPKHMVSVEGEPVLNRTVRLFAERGCEVVVVGPPDERYRIEGSRLVTLAVPHPTETSMDKVFANVPLWNTEGRTTIVWGDCYYSEDAADKIAKCRAAGVHYFRRPGPSEITGHRWDESFACSFTKAAHQDMLEAAERVLGEAQAGRIKNPHMFNHYAACLGLPDIRDVSAVYGTPRQTHIDDWSDDFDRPKEYREWSRRRAARCPVSIVIMAHPERRAWAEALGEELSARVIWDNGEGHIATALRCLEAYDPEATHHIVLQDDAIPAKGFREMAERIAALAGPEPVCHYTGGRLGISHGRSAKQRFVAARKRDASWFLTNGPFWGVGVSHPVARLPEVIELFRAHDDPGDDPRLRSAYGELGIPCWYPVPSLVEHRDGGSLLHAHRKTGRVALEFAPDATAFNPYGPVLSNYVPEPTRPRVYAPVWRKEA